MRCMMENISTFNKILKNRCLPLTAKLKRVNKRLVTVKENLTLIFSEYANLMAHAKQLKGLTDKEAMLDIFFEIRKPCVNFKIAAEQYKNDKDTFINKFMQLSSPLLQEQHENFNQLQLILDEDKDDIDESKRSIINKYRSHLKCIENDFNEFNNFYNSGTIEKSINTCEATLQDLFNRAKQQD